MSQAHKLDAESEAIDYRFVIQREEDTDAIELVGSHIREGPGPNYPDDDYPKITLQAV